MIISIPVQILAAPFDFITFLPQHFSSIGQKIFKPGACQPKVGFLKLLLSTKSVCACVSSSKAINYIRVILNNQLNKFVVFEVAFKNVMKLSTGCMHGHGFCNKACLK